MDYKGILWKINERGGAAVCINDLYVQLLNITSDLNTSISAASFNQWELKNPELLLWLVGQWREQSLLRELVIKFDCQQV